MSMSLASIPLATKLIGGCAGVALMLGGAVVVVNTSAASTDSAGPEAAPGQTYAELAGTGTAGPAEPPDSPEATDGEDTSEQVATTDLLDPATGEPLEEIDDDAEPTGDGQVVPGPYVPRAPSGSGASGGGDSGGSGTPTPFNPTEPVAPTICDLVDDDQQRFATDADVVLERGVFTGSVEITNCSDSAFDVGLKSVASVALAADTVALPAAGSTSIAFDIDADAWGDGSIDFKVKVQQGDCCSDYTKVHGFKGDLVNDFTAATDFATNPGAGGCNTDCITRALLTPRTLTTDIDIEVATNTPAEIDVFVSEQSPVPNQAGDPSMPGVSPSASSNGLQTGLTATLTDMDQATDYYLLVRAIDDNGHATIAHHSFRSVTPVDLTDDLATAPGCANRCITMASVVATSHSTASIAVASDVPALFDAEIGTEPIKMSGGVPTLSGEVIRVASDGLSEAWEEQPNGLKAATTYSIVLTATDEFGGRDVQSATFTTNDPPPPTRNEVTAWVERIEITYDADPVKWDAGEISMGWSLGDVLMGQRGESKMDKGDHKWINQSNEVRSVLSGAEPFDSINIWVGERDGYGLGFCESPVVGLPCHGLKWEQQKIEGLTANDVYLLPQCWTLDYPDDDPRSGDRCLKVSTPSFGRDTPGFDTIVRFTVRIVE